MAIGANRGDVIRMVLPETAVLIVASLGIGLPRGVGINPAGPCNAAKLSLSDPGTFGAVGLIMVAAASSPG